MTNKNTDKVDSVEINSTESLVPEFSVFAFKTNIYSHSVASEQVRMLFGYSQLISISNSFFAALFVAFMWPSNSHFMLLTWLGVIFTISLFRWFSAVFYNKRNKETDNTSAWINVFMLLTAVNSTTWGVASVIFFSSANVGEQYLIALFIFGLASLGISIFSIIPKVMYALLIPTMLPFTILMILQDGYSFHLLAIGMMFAFLFFIFASRKSYINTYENIYYHIKEVEQRKTLVLAKELVEKSSKAKSDFLSRMSHELRTPLNAILGFSQMLELDADDLSHTQKDNVSEILNAGQHLLNLINEVLDLSRIESGKLDIHLENISVSRSLHEAIKLIQEQAKNRHIHIVDHISEQDFYVYADAIRLKQVLVNLLSNAVKYNCDHGEIILEAHVIDGLYLTINITDTGEGLTEQEVDLLFVPFDRLNATNNVEGTGIGLVITQHLITLMNGKLHVISSRGKGSTFSIELLLPEV